MAFLLPSKIESLLWRRLAILLLTALIGTGVFVTLKLKPSWLFPYPDLSEIIWTCNADFTEFFGPNTPQSTEVVARIDSMRELGYLTSDDPAFREATLVTPALFSNGPDQNVSFPAGYPMIVVGFTPEVGQRLRKEHIERLESE